MEAARLEALTPPAQLSEWHLLNIETLHFIQAFVDLQPRDDVISFIFWVILSGVSAASEEELGEVAIRLPADILQRMMEAGCIDPEDLPSAIGEVPDDHGDDIDSATAIRVGSGVEAAVNYGGDVDYFSFQAERGQSYQIDVALGLLNDSLVELYDADGMFLDGNDEYSGSTASRLSWQASSSGELYVAVAAFGSGMGTYTLTVSPSATSDEDHGNNQERATRIATGEVVAVELDNLDDREVFVFRARPGTEYVLTLDWESYEFISTTERPLLAVFDTDGAEQIRLMGYDIWGISVPSIDLHWHTVTGGDYYITVGDGNTRGNFALTVDEDHGNNRERATRIAIGEVVAVELDNLDDREVFVFRASPGTEYVLTLDWEAYEMWDNPGSIMDLYDAGGELLARLNDYDFSEQKIRNRLMWQAVTEGDYYIAIGDGNTLGNFALTVSGGEATEPEATPAPTEPPTPPADSFDSVSAGWQHTCGVRSDGSVACWGSDRFGQATPPAGSFDSVSAGWQHTCGVRSDGSVVCWGSDRFGQATPPAGSFDSVSAGSGHTCGVRSDGSVACWGLDNDGRATPPAGSFVSVSAGPGHACGVRNDGSVACWGLDNDGRATPPAGSFVSVSAGSSHTCGVKSDGSVACWGYDESGEATPPAGSFTSVSASWWHTCGVRSNGSVPCWGDDDFGRATPPAGSFDSVSAGWYHTCGVMGDSSVACWGSNEFGEATPPE